MSGTLRSQVLVLGGSGTVGSGIVAALLEAGASVLAVGRHRDRLQALRQHFADDAPLEVMVGSVADDATAAALAAMVAERPYPLAGVVAAIGSPLNRGRLIDRPASAMLRRLQRDLLPHLAAARHLLPLLGDLGGRYVLVGSPNRAWAGHGDASIAAAARRMLAQVLNEEAQQLGVRVQMLAVEEPVCTPQRPGGNCADWPDPLTVGRSAVALLAGCGVPVEVFVEVDKRFATRSVQGWMAGVSFPLTSAEVSP